MSRRKPSAPGNNHLRRAVASAAARLMAESGESDYGIAKRKAAQALGVQAGETLPTNDEIEVELRTYQAIFQDEEQKERLLELRQVALETMHLLSDFQPRLRGSVLDGTAGRYAQIDLMLFADSSKDVEIWLLSHGIPYEAGDIRQHIPDGPETRLELDQKGIGIQLEIFHTSQSRANPTGQRTSRYRHSANIEAVKQLIAAPDSQTQP